MREKERERKRTKTIPSLRESLLFQPIASSQAISIEKVKTEKRRGDLESEREREEKEIEKEREENPCLREN